jgi:lipopolysaccharide biosynthesis protein
MHRTTAKILAYYLPQFHPVPENNEWWGKGFTEWTNVAKAKPLFKGHWQPRLPADLGFYDLRVPEVREAQAELARNHGVDGFIYYHYWFGNGRRLLERPFNEVLTSGKPDFPFCLCWANHTWSGVWYGESERVLMEQRYGGRADYEKHFETLLPAFEDERYIRVDDKPVFQVLSPREIPNASAFVDTFRALAAKAGLAGLYLIAGDEDEGSLPELGYDAVVSIKFPQALRRLTNRKDALVQQALGRRIIQKIPGLKERLKRHVATIDYKDVIAEMVLTEPFPYEYIPCVVPNWDNTPRSGARGTVVAGSTPELFEKHLRNAVEFVQNSDQDNRLVFIKSWNEWAEGNYLEPDQRFGLQYLEAVRAVVGIAANSDQREELEDALNAVGGTIR